MKTTLRWEPPSPLIDQAVMGPGGDLELIEQEVLGVLLPGLCQATAPSPAALLEQGASRYPQSPYVVHPDGVVSFGEAAGLVANLADHLRRRVRCGQG